MQLYKHHNEEPCATQQAHPCVISVFHTDWVKPGSRYGICYSLFVYIYIYIYIYMYIQVHEIFAAPINSDNRRCVASSGFECCSLHKRQSKCTDLLCTLYSLTCQEMQWDGELSFWTFIVYVIINILCKDMFTYSFFKVQIMRNLTLLRIEPVFVWHFPFMTTNGLRYT